MISLLRKILLSFFYRILILSPYFHFIKNTRSHDSPITFSYWYNQKILGKRKEIYWPVHPTSTISGNWRNIYCGIDTSPGYSPGNYIQCIGKIYVGDYTMIGPNVGIISANHDLYDKTKHIIKEVRIGKYCWLGMGSIILPGTVLGNFTIVAAGSVVTKSFKEGYCVIGGNPAEIIKHLDKHKCIEYKHKVPYNGYIPNSIFEKFRKKNLNV